MHGSKAYICQKALRRSYVAGSYRMVRVVVRVVIELWLVNTIISKKTPYINVTTYSWLYGKTLHSLLVPICIII